MGSRAHTVINMKLRYNVRVYPSASQRGSLARAFGCARVVWNDALPLRRDAYEQGLPRPTAAELSKRVITEAKKTPERAWLGDVSAVVLQQSLRDLEAAYSNFFGRKIASPKFFRRQERKRLWAPTPPWPSMSASPGF
jgi:putative transposase